MNLTPPYILLDDQITPLVRIYQNPVEIISVTQIDDIDSAFEKLSQYHHHGKYIAGYLSYELGYTLEPKLHGMMPDALNGPLMQFGVFENVETQDRWEYYRAENPDIQLDPDWNAQQYMHRFDSVIDYLKAGDVYQINLTFPMRGNYSGQALDLYSGLRQRQPGKYGGIVSLGEPEIISLSPELFFQKSSTDMRMRPMKGTVQRSADMGADQVAATTMLEDTKSRAENLMIVDLLRNDLSRISIPGTVKVPELFALETYPTLHQMTSVVTSHLQDNIDIRNIIQSLFPSGSITGAPKIRAMEIIHELEETPRGAYCGSLGYIDPNGDACFNVGIRTITLDNNEITYNVGSGVVLDSQAQAEYEECLLKAKILERTKPDLIETMRWDPEHGFIRLGRHLGRLRKSAAALSYPFDGNKIHDAFKTLQNENTSLRVRLTLSDIGDIRVTHTPFDSETNPKTISISKNPLTYAVQETRYKTTDRDFYDGERERVKPLTGCDEVIFLNDEGELCEGTFTNLFIEKDGSLFTPKLSCGLLPGILREELLETGQVAEAFLKLDDLRNADSIYIGNSLRGLIKAELTSYDLC